MHQKVTAFLFLPLYAHFLRTTIAGVLSQEHTVFMCHFLLLVKFIPWLVPPPLVQYKASHLGRLLLQDKSQEKWEALKYCITFVSQCSHYTTEFAAFSAKLSFHYCVWGYVAFGRIHLLSSPRKLLPTLASYSVTNCSTTNPVVRNMY